MDDDVRTIDDDYPLDEVHAEELPELVEVKINDAVWLGLCFGFGLGLALIFYGLIGLFVVKVILIEMLMP